MDQPGFTPDSVREISFAVEPNGYDMDIVDGLLVDIANVLHEGVVPADLIPIDPAVQLPTKRRGYRRDEVDRFLAELRSDGASRAGSQKPTVPLLASTTLVIRKPAILGDDGTPLGRVEYRDDGLLAVTDASGRTVLRVRVRTMSWWVTDATGSEIGRIKQWSGVLHQRPGRTKLYAEDGLIGRCQVELPSATAWARHTWGRPPRRRYIVTDAAKNEVARIAADTTKGTKVTLELLQAIPEPLRSLVVCTAICPAYPRSYEGGESPVQW